MKSDQTALAAGEGQCVSVGDLFHWGGRSRAYGMWFDGNLLKT